MDLRPTTLDDMPFIDKLDDNLFADRETYPFGRPMLTYYAMQALRGEGVSNDEANIPGVTGLQSFTIFRQGHVAGVMVLRPWQDLLAVGNRRYGANDQELFFLGIAPEYRRGGLARESLRFALQQHALQNRNGTTLTRFKPACTIYARMLSQDDFGILDDTPSGRRIGYRYSADNTIQLASFQDE